MTPLQNINNFYFKREDQNPTGSAKDKAIPHQIKNLISQGFKSAVISSTGNAAISASYYCQQNNIPLTIFVSPHISLNKKNLIKGNIIVSKKPISDAIKFSKNNQSYFLRQSTDPFALMGYSQIGTEILSQLPEVTSIFVPVGSGATLLGIASILPKNVKIFAVQSAFNPTITNQFDQTNTEPNNLTDALTVKYLPLKQKIISAITTGITVSNQELQNSQEWLINHQIIASNEAGLTLAGAMKAQTKFEIGNFPVILITGTKR